MISIIVPVYNAEKYIERCVDSIIKHNKENFELILVDDGSTDHSPSICDRYATKDNRVIVHHQTNGGASAARNKGIEYAKGEWVVFVDADDEVCPGLIEKIESAPLSAVDVVFWGYRMIFQDRIVDSTPPRGLINENNFSTVFTKCEIYTPWSKAFRRDILIEHNIRFNTELKNGEDTLFMFQILNSITEAFLIDCTLYIHYVIDGSLSNKMVPYHLNLGLLNHVTELSNSILQKYRLTAEAKNKIKESICICIGRILYMNIPNGKFRKNQEKLDKINIELYCKYTQPKTIKGKIFKFLLKRRLYLILDVLCVLCKRSQL